MMKIRKVHAKFLRIKSIKLLNVMSLQGKVVSLHKVAKLAKFIPHPTIQVVARVTDRAINVYRAYKKFKA